MSTTYNTYLLWELLPFCLLVLSAIIGAVVGIGVRK